MGFGAQQCENGSRTRSAGAGAGAGAPVSRPPRAWTDGSRTASAGHGVLREDGSRTASAGHGVLREDGSRTASSDPVRVRAQVPPPDEPGGVRTWESGTTPT